MALPGPQAALSAAPATDGAVAVVAADQFASRRIAAALEAAGLCPTSVSGSADELVRERAIPWPDAVALACDPTSADALAAVRKLTRGPRQTRVVIVSSAADGAGVRQALSAGATGVIYESELERTLAATTRSVLVGQISLPRQLHRCVVKPAFSHREKQVLAMVVKGLSNREIAGHLFLAESTVKSHLATAFDKLGVHSRKEAAALLVDPDEGLGESVLAVELEQPALAGRVGVTAP